MHVVQFCKDTSYTALDLSLVFIVQFEENLICTADKQLIMGEVAKVIRVGLLTASTKSCGIKKKNKRRQGNYVMVPNTGLWRHILGPYSS